MIISTKRNYDQGQEKIPSNLLPINKQENENKPNNEPIYNHGREAIPIANNEKLSLQNIDEDVLQHLKNEMKTLKQEIMQNLRQEILQNNEQASNSNITKN